MKNNIHVRRLIVTVMLAGLITMVLAGCGSKSDEWSVSGLVRWGGTNVRAAGVPVALGDARTVTQADGTFTLSGPMPAGNPQGTLIIGGDIAVEARQVVSLQKGLILTEPFVLTRIYHVAPDGNNDNDGSILHPLRSIANAMCRLEWKRVQLEPGTYLENTIAMGDRSELIGDPDAPSGYVIYYSGYDSIIMGDGTEFRVSGVKLEFQRDRCFAAQLFDGARGAFDHCIINVDTTSHGISVVSGASLQMSDCTITGGYEGIKVMDYSTDNRTSVTLRRVQLSGCTYGIYADKTYGAGYDVSVMDCSITGSPFGGIYLEGSDLQGEVGTLTVSGSSISNNGYGIMVYGGQINLGGTVAGGNTFFNNTDYSLYDVRPAGSGALSAVGNTWGTALAGTVNGPTVMAPHYRIINSGNSIVFSN